MTRIVPDDDTLFCFEEELSDPESQETLNIIKRGCGPGPFLGRKAYANQIVLIDPATKEAVYKNSAGSITINRGFVKKFHS